MLIAPLAFLYFLSSGNSASCTLLVRFLFSLFLPDLHISLTGFRTRRRWDWWSWCGCWCLNGRFRDKSRTYFVSAAQKRVHFFKMLEWLAYLTGGLVVVFDFLCPLNGRLKSTRRPRSRNCTLSLPGRQNTRPGKGQGGLGYEWNGPLSGRVIWFDPLRRKRFGDLRSSFRNEDKNEGFDWLCDPPHERDHALGTSGCREKAVCHGVFSANCLRGPNKCELQVFNGELWG